METAEKVLCDGFICGGTVTVDWLVMGKRRLWRRNRDRYRIISEDIEVSM